MRYLLDTNICIYIARRKPARVLSRLRQMQPGFFRAELGFFLERGLWGTGVFNEATRLLLDFSRRVLKVHRVEARVAVDNDQSFDRLAPGEVLRVLAQQVAIGVRADRLCGCEPGPQDAHGAASQLYRLVVPQVVRLVLAGRVGALPDVPRPHLPDHTRTRSP